MTGKLQLKYSRKTPKKKIIEDKPSATLKEVKSFGQSLFAGYQNMLILGDNLIALKLLYRNKEIKNKIKLVYIDPPFATNQVYKGSKGFFKELETQSITKFDVKLY